MHSRSWLVVVCLLCACGGRGGNDRDAGVDSGVPDSGSNAGDGGAEANIESALSCGTPQRLTGVAQNGELQAIELDRAQFPDALCNDGTPPVLYYRPAVGAQNRNRWVISLRGGGGCSGAASCAARWCSCNSTARCPSAVTTTNFTLNNMSGGGARSQDVGGVLHRGAFPNPLEDYNHVQLIYCSSDGWRGAARGVEYTTTHPITGQSVTYVMHFMGTKILEAELKILRQEGVAPLTYSLQTTPEQLPDLDDAEEVVVVGDSAGGAGVINNLDWIAGTLRASHSGCDGGAACPPSVMGVMDAIVGPDLSRLDWSNSAGRDAGIVTWDAFTTLSASSPSMRTGRGEESCEAWHRANRPGTESACSDGTHLVRHHVTTPFFVRMALFDGLISTNYEELGLADPVLGPFVRNGQGVPITFGTVLHRELTAFPMLPGVAEEGAAMTRAPGVFAPSCSNHDTIHTNSEVYGVTISPDAGGTWAFFDVFTAWRDGGMPAAVLSQDSMRRDTVCP